MLLVLTGCGLPRGIEAIQVLGDITASGGPSWLKDATPAPTRTIISSGQSTAILGDLYWPGDTAEAALVLIPGAVPAGKDDPRLVAFANTLARAGFVVLVPEIPNLRTQQLSAEDAVPIRRALDLLAACIDPAARSHSVGMVAISYAAGPALLAGLEPDEGAPVRFMAAVGGYFDTTAVVTFFTTGYFREHADVPWQHATPNAYGKWIFVRANAARLSDPEDRAALAEIAAQKLNDPAADVTALRADLGPEGQAVMALLDNSDPNRVPALIEALPPAIQSELAALDLSARDLASLPFELILIHGRDDPIVPSSESIALAASAPEDRVSLYVVDSLGHIDLSFGGIGDGVRLFQAADQLLVLRDAMPSPDPDRCEAALNAWSADPPPVQVR